MAILTNNDGAYGETVSSDAPLSGNDIYSRIFPGVDHYDAIQGVAKIDPPSTIEHAVGVSGYTWVAQASPTNGVGLFGCGIAGADGAAVWGLNTLLQDSDTRASGSAAGRILIGAELDFNVMNPATQVIGVSVGGNSLVQSANAVAFMVNTLSQSLGYKWQTGFYSMDGCATYALVAGPKTKAGGNIDSQEILLQNFNTAGAKKNTTIRAQNKSLRISHDDTDFTLNVDGWLNIPTGKGFAVGGQQVVSSRKAAIADPSATVSSCRTAIIAILNAMRAHGLIA